MIIDFIFRIIKPNEQIALLSDFDGTLAEINPNPYETLIKPESKEALDKLNARPNVFLSIISGRRLMNLQCKVGIENITYSGNHGMEIFWANQTGWTYPITEEMYVNCTKLKELLSTEVSISPLRRRLEIIRLFCYPVVRHGQKRWLG